MRNLFAVVATLAWALWLGGLLALFIFVQTLFKNDRPLAVQTAPQLFHVFEKYQLLLAAMSLVATFGWRLSRKSKASAALFWLLSAATVGAIVSPLVITPKIDALHAANRTHTPEFAKLHGESMMIYIGQSIILLAAGILLPGAMRTTPNTAPASVPRAAPAGKSA